MKDKFPIPAEFLQRMSFFLGDEFPLFYTSLREEPVNGLRVNTLKLSVDEFKKISPFPLGEPVGWSKVGFHLPPMEASPGNHPYHRAGLFYLQDPSAMAPAELLNPQPNEWILDLAAAPGGKTTHLASLMKGQGLLIANEIKDKRVGHLAMNVERWGAGNIVVTNETPERLADHFGPCFDSVLVDAPCSGEGMFRKDEQARKDWSMEMVKGCSIRQNKILRVASKLVRPGGKLVYSTCTFSPEEDEEVIAQFLSEVPGFEVEKLPLSPGFLPGNSDWMGNKEKWGEKMGQVRGAVRLFPHRLIGEGHFVCVLKRGEGTSTQHKLRSDYQIRNISNAQIDQWEYFSKSNLTKDFPHEYFHIHKERLYLLPEEIPDLGSLRVIHPGVWMGTFKKDRFEPAHPLALYLKEEMAANTINLKLEDSEISAYLRGEIIPSKGPKGWVLVAVNGWPLGWGKRVEGILKNHYPRGWM